MRPEKRMTEANKKSNYKIKIKRNRGEKWEITKKGRIKRNNEKEMKGRKILKKRRKKN
jgi:hypothetical protein